MPRLIRRSAIAAAAVSVSIGVAAPASAQYGEESLLPGGGTGPGATVSKSYLRKKCIAKAQSKFGDNRPKKKAAIRKCKKKYR